MTRARLLSKAATNGFSFIPTVLAENLELSFAIPIVLRERAWILSLFIALSTPSIGAGKVGLRSPIKSNEFGSKEGMRNMCAD